VNWTIAIGVLAALGSLGWLANVIQAILGRGKGRADAAAVVADSAIELLAPFREEIRALRAEVAELRAGVRQLTRDVDDRDQMIRDRDATILSLQGRRSG
jgi:uncharacterized protein YydD (DUF2326 family)